MQERSVTIAGENHKLDLPYFVLATQNPIEQEGTYPLPEAQLDRFVCYKTRISFVLERSSSGKQTTSDIKYDKPIVYRSGNN
jgi:MoxR-like ATPase